MVSFVVVAQSVDSQLLGGNEVLRVLERVLVARVEIWKTVLRSENLSR